jgi:hypothetical protein
MLCRMGHEQAKRYFWMSVPLALMHPAEAQTVDGGNAASILADSVLNCFRFEPIDVAFRMHHNGSMIQTLTLDCRLKRAQTTNR